MNLVDEDLTVSPTGSGAGSLHDVLDGAAVTGPVALPPFGVRVLRQG